MGMDIFILVMIFILYLLLVKGVLWKAIVFIFGFFGMYAFLNSYFPHSKSICISIMNHGFSWAEVIPFVIVLLAMACTKVE